MAYIFYYVVMYFDDIYYVVMMFGRIHKIKWDPRILFPHGMGWRALIIVGLEYKQCALEEIWGLKCGLIRKPANSKFCELEFKNQ